MIELSGVPKNNQVKLPRAHAIEYVAEDTWNILFTNDDGTEERDRCDVDRILRELELAVEGIRMLKIRANALKHRLGQADLDTSNKINPLAHEQTK
jgi:hypothetical protein